VSLKISLWHLEIRGKMRRERRYYREVVMITGESRVVGEAERRNTPGLVLLGCIILFLFIPRIAYGQITQSCYLPDGSWFHFDGVIDAHGKPPHIQYHNGGEVIRWNALTLTVLGKAEEMSVGMLQKLVESGCFKKYGNWLRNTVGPSAEMQAKMSRLVLGVFNEVNGCKNWKNLAKQPKILGKLVAGVAKRLALPVTVVFIMLNTTQWAMAVEPSDPNYNKPLSKFVFEQTFDTVSPVPWELAEWAGETMLGRLSEMFDKWYVTKLIQRQYKCLAIAQIPGLTPEEETCHAVSKFCDGGGKWFGCWGGRPDLPFLDCMILILEMRRSGQLWPNDVACPECR
jgi:hypothetical protein